VHALLARTGESKTRRLKAKTQPFTDLILHATKIFTSPTLTMETETDLPKRQSQELAETFAKN
jgi:hypothetical protein